MDGLILAGDVGGTKTQLGLFEHSAGNLELVRERRYATADFHRCLLEGGIYMYPGEVAEGGKAKGKLRLMYELAPLSMVAEQAGGRGSTGKNRILDVAATAIHERHPIYIGSAEGVALAESFKVEG